MVLSKVASLNSRNFRNLVLGLSLPSSGKVGLGVVRIFRSKNNIFFTLALLNRTLLYQGSAGLLGLSGSRRDSPTSAELAGKAFAERAVRLGIHFCYLRVYGRFDGCMRGAFRGIRRTSLVVLKLRFAPLVSHNGVRRKKLRRV